MSVFNYYMYQLKKIFFDFLPKYCKKVIFGHFSAPWAAPCIENPVFLHIYWAEHVCILTKGI